MSVSPSDLLSKIEREIERAKAAIERARDRERVHAKRLERIADNQTDAFVELAKHYLPELSHHSIANAWEEVRSEIRDVLHQREYQRDQLNEKLAEVKRIAAEQATRIEIARQELDEAKVVLACKLGNVRKLLREDPSVVSSSNRIQQLDAEIESCLAKLDIANAEARKKLAAYEESSLFSYLLERGYGTADYSGSRFEQRWDRWVARLINFDRAKKGYDTLTQSPVFLRKLVDEKQQQYRAMLDKLRNAKQNATRIHGVREQREKWKLLRERVEVLENELESNFQQQIDLQNQLVEFEGIAGQYYEEAVEIFRNFLQSLQPDVLKIYAECTPSHEDDRVCSRIRRMQSDIELEKRSAKRRFLSIVKNEKLVSGLREVSDRLRRFLMQNLGEVYFDSTFDFDAILEDMRRKQLPPSRAWRQIRESMVDRYSPDHTTDQSSELAHEIGPLDAWFTAASEFARRVPEGNDIDLSAVMLCNASAESIPNPESSFTTLAICPSRREAKFLERKLRGASIPCFSHTRATRPDRDDSEFEVDLVVASVFVQEAANLITQLRWEFEQSWRCRRCSTNVDEGFSKCWRCGQPRPLEITKSVA